MSRRQGGVDIARWTSILLHPFAVFAGLALLAAWRLQPASLPRVAIGIGVAIAVLWLFVLQRQRSGRWGTVDASDPRERPALYVLALLLALGNWWWLGGQESVLAPGLLLVIGMLLLAAAVNRWIKLSLHMASLAFAAVALLALALPVGIVAMALLPLLAWSRLRLGRHRPAEVIAGGVLGVLAGALLHVS